MSSYSMPDKAYRARSREEIPRGAVIMTREEIIEYNMRRIGKWEPHYEMWPFTVGCGILSGATVIGAAFINGHFRNKFFLGNLVKFVTFAPTVVIPALATATSQYMMVQETILAGEVQCPVCVEMRCGALQALIGVLYPAVISPIITIINARKFKTCSIPQITERKQLLNMLYKVSPRYSFFVLVMMNFGVGMFVAGQQMSTFNKLLLKDVHEKEFSSEGFS